MMTDSQRHRILYLACPYTDSSPQVRAERFDAANKAAAFLIARGHIVFSPVTMSHPIDAVLAGADETLGTHFWLAFDEAFMEFCSEIFILKLAGWQKSTGIERERRFFESRSKPVYFLDPDLPDYGLPKLTGRT
jgi:hypothetical protein